MATLGVSSVIVGLLSWYTNGESVLGTFPDQFISIGSWPWPLVLLSLAALLLWYLLEQTPWGRRLYAVGSNREAARLVGIDVATKVTLSFVLSGALAGFAGVVAVARNGGANPTVGPALLLPALAAAYLGATAFRRWFNPLGTVVGVLSRGVHRQWLHPGRHRTVGEGRHQRDDAARGGDGGRRTAAAVAIRRRLTTATRHLRPAAGAVMCSGCLNSKGSLSRVLCRRGRSRPLQVGLVRFGSTGAWGEALTSGGDGGSLPPPRRLPRVVVVSADPAYRAR